MESLKEAARKAYEERGYQIKGTFTESKDNKRIIKIKGKMDIHREIIEDVEWKLPTLTINAKLKDGTLLHFNAQDTKFDTVVTIKQVTELQDLNKAITELLQHLNIK